MPWEEKTVEKTREEFIGEIKKGEKSKSAICREYNISRKTGDKWIARYEAGEELTNRSRAPFRTPNKTAAEMEEKVLQIRTKHPVWGPRKIWKTLARAGLEEIPAPSTIAGILKRNGCVTPAASAASTPYKRFQRESSNELWQTDFKGHFAMKNGVRCHPLTVLDDYSRYSLCVDAKENEQREGVIESFMRLFDTYGLPEALLCDNGNPWGTSQSTGYTFFEILLMNYGILPIHGRPLHPQTQGKEERFHRTLKAELISLVEIENMENAQELFDEFRDCYNNERPHEALELGVPSDYYRPSTLAKPDKIRDWIYPNDFICRKIKTTGYLTYGSQGYFLSESFGGRTIGIKESSISGRINLYYREFKIGVIDLNERAFVSKKIYRADPGTAGGEN